MSINTFKETCKKSKGDGTLLEYEKRLKRLREHFKTNAIEDLNPDEVNEYISLQSRYPDDRLKSKSTPESYRSALLHYFKYQIRKDIPVEYYEDLATFIRGHKKQIASGRLGGSYKATEGKDVLEFNQYHSICNETVRDNNYDGHLYLVMMWNTTCRSISSGSLNFTHISWRSDALVICVPKDKTHQLGANRGDIQELRVYSNPLDPTICPFFALGMKIICDSTVKQNTTVFHGSDKQNFSKAFFDWIIAHEKGDKSETDYGTHSIRKGSISWALSFPGAASAIAALLRGGWNLGGVMPRYVRQSVQGDETVGRLLSGLPSGHSDFCLIPARFQSSALSLLKFDDLIPDYFKYPDCFKDCVPFLIATVVNNINWIKDHLSTDHPFFLSRLWRSGKFKLLQSMILKPTKMYCDETKIQATGLNVLSIVLYKLDNLNVEIEI